MVVSRNECLVACIGNLSYYYDDDEHEQDDDAYYIYWEDGKHLETCRSFVSEYLRGTP